MDPHELTRSFLSLAVSPAGFDVLFEHLPDVYFFVKLVQAGSEREVIGKRDRDFFPEGLAQTFARDDRAVLETSQAMIEKAELVRHPDGSVDWFCTTKLPVLDAQERAIGICGITRDVKRI